MESRKSNSYTYKGEVYYIGPLQTFASGFAKRILVCKEEDSPTSKYPNYAAFEFVKSKSEKGAERIAALDRLITGTQVEVSFYIDARENPNKPGQWFSANRAFKIEVLRDAQPAMPEYPSDDDEPQISDDMPF